MNGPNCTEAQLCRADFYYLLSQALEEAGGRSDPAIIEKYQNLKLSEFVDIVAQNGLRIVYRPRWHITKGDPYDN